VNSQILIKVAEEVNKLDAVFNNLDEQYSKDLENPLNLLWFYLSALLWDLL